MSYTGNSYGYLFNYPKESRSKFSNQNLISSPLNNLNLNYSNNKPPSTYRNKKKEDHHHEEIMGTNKKI